MSSAPLKTTQDTDSLVSDIAIFVLKRDVKLQLTNTDSRDVESLTGVTLSTSSLLMLLLLTPVPRGV